MVTIFLGAGRPASGSQFGSSRRNTLDPVPSFALGSVHGGICQADQVFNRGDFFMWHHCDANTYADPQLAERAGKLDTLDALAQPLGDQIRSFERGLRQEQGEFLAAETGR